MNQNTKIMWITVHYHNGKEWQSKWVWDSKGAEIKMDRLIPTMEPKKPWTEEEKEEANRIIDELIKEGLLKPIKEEK